MAYFDNYNKNDWHDIGEMESYIHPYPLTDDDIRRCAIIADEISSRYQRRELLPSKSLTFGNVLQNSANVYYNLGMHTSAKRAFSILNSIQYQDNKSDHPESLTVQSYLVRTGATVCKKPCCVDVPRVFNTSSVYFMVHEIAHMLKEENPAECKGIYTNIEVIPMLLELISAKQKGNNNVFKIRESMMVDIAYNFKRLREDLDNGLISSDDMIAFNTLFNHNACYLNSFYYTLRLYSMYLDSPTYVLGIIDDVLNHRLTTRDVINRYLNGDNYSYEDGLREFRSKLK